MKAKLSLSDRTSFSRFSHRLRIDCVSEGIDGVKVLSFASAILHHKKHKNPHNTSISRSFDFKRKTKRAKRVKDNKGITSL